MYMFGIYYTSLRGQQVRFEGVNFFLVIGNHIYYFANFLQLHHYQRTENIKHPTLSDHDHVFPKEILLL